MHPRTTIALALAALTALSACSKPDAGQDVKSGTSSAELPKTSEPRERREPEKPETPPEPAADVDLKFIDSMWRHHDDAVAMARLAATQASRAELQEFAAGIITDQERQVALLKEWRGQWYAGRSDASGGMKRMGTGELARLTGPAFDAKFLAMMIDHHQGGASMARSSLDRIQHAELKALAQQIADVQSQEIAKMQAWQAAWGGAAPPDTGHTH
jgi:uncharacterized protein (DUF305 family)